MSSKKWYVVFALFLMFSLIASSCGQAETPTPEVIIQTQIVEVEGEQVVEYVEITATPQPEKELNEEDVVTITWWELKRDVIQPRPVKYTTPSPGPLKKPIQIQKLPWHFSPSRGFSTRVLTAIAADRGPDIWYHYWSPDIATQGFLEDLTLILNRMGSTLQKCTSRLVISAANMMANIMPCRVMQPAMYLPITKTFSMLRCRIPAGRLDSCRPA